MKYLLLLCFSLALFSCKNEPDNGPAPQKEVLWEPEDESAALKEQSLHENPRMRFKLINSKVFDKNDIWKPFEEELSAFSGEQYERLKPLILEKSIPELQQTIREGKLSYTQLALFYIYRIRKFESDNKVSLNAVIALNPDVLKQAKRLDARGKLQVNENSVYGMPVLLKDNINTSTMATTAGAIALAENRPGQNAFIVERLLDHKALILGKANLSEWAYYFCEGCPLGYSAVGGQTLNPYGRRKFETGGSSSGSGVAVAANYAVAAVGTETAGSILSPSSQNSVVGLKPTVGLLSRTGVVPISSTLDTPGPMTRTVIDNAIVLNAMTGLDSLDPASVAASENYVAGLRTASLKGKRIGIMRPLLSDSLYKAAVEAIKGQGAILVEYDPAQIALEGFSTLLQADMKRDLPQYFSRSAGEGVVLDSVRDVVVFNQEDSILRAPYGQELFKGIVGDTTTTTELEQLSQRLEDKGRLFFDQPMDAHHLDVVLSINNYHAAYAAVAKYPALTVPMGYQETGEPKNITFIARPFEEEKLLELGYAFEQLLTARRPPENYR